MAKDENRHERCIKTVNGWMKNYTEHEASKLRGGKTKPFAVEIKADDPVLQDPVAIADMLVKLDEAKDVDGYNEFGMLLSKVTGIPWQDTRKPVPASMEGTPYA